MKILIKRIYEPVGKSDGVRVLVDRLWPRGLSKEVAKLDLWMPDLGPSATLRQWFNHGPAWWEEFSRRYHAELNAKQELVAELKKQAKKGTVMLLYSTFDGVRANRVGRLLTEKCLRRTVTASEEYGAKQEVATPPGEFERADYRPSNQDRS